MEYIKPRTLQYLVLIACIVVLMSMLRFEYIYPDSTYYLDMVKFYSGDLSIEPRAPYCYRPLLPLIASVVPLPPTLTFTIVNMIFLIMIGWVIFFISLRTGTSDKISFLTTLTFIVSLVYLLYGAVVLVDIGAVFFLLLAYYYMAEEGQNKKITILLTVGVLFKEIALVGVITYLIYRRFEDFWLMAIPTGTYIILRTIIPASNPGFMWPFHLETFTLHLDGTLKTIIFGMLPYLVLLILAYPKGHQYDMHEIQKWYEIKNWLIASGIPAMAYLFLGLFFAYFDARFLWPTYLALVPIWSVVVSEFVNIFKRSEFIIYPDE